MGIVIVAIINWTGLSVPVLAKLGGGFAECCESRIPNLIFLFIVFNTPLFCPLNAEFGDA